MLTSHMGLFARWRDSPQLPQSNDTLGLSDYSHIRMDGFSVKRFNDIVIVTEIRRLIDEQMKTLRGELTEEECMDYAERSSRIKELLEQLGGVEPRRNERACASTRPWLAAD